MPRENQNSEQIVNTKTISDLNLSAADVTILYPGSPRIL